MLTELNSDTKTIGGRAYVGAGAIPSMEAKPVRKVITVIDPRTKRPRELTIVVDDGQPSKPKYVPKEKAQVPIRGRRKWDGDYGNTTNEPGSYDTEP